MAHGSGKRLLLSALVKGLGEAVRCNDQSAAERYRGRLRLAAEQIAADDPVRDALGRLLLLSGLWIAAAAADRVTPRSKCLKSSNALSGCSHHDDDSAVALSVVS
jgi:hypothetical protein